MEAKQKMAAPTTPVKDWHCTACPGSKFNRRHQHQYRVHAPDGTKAEFVACSGAGCGWCQIREGK